MRQAVILCGGRGSRLGDLTSDIPKPMLEVAGAPFLDHLINHLLRFGIDKIILSAGYLGQVIYDRYHLKQGLRARFEVFIESTAQGTGGAVLNILDAVEDSFLVINGDTFYDMDYVEFFNWVTSCGLIKKNVLATVEVRNNERYGAVQTNEAGLVTSFKEKLAASDRCWVNSGIYFFQKADLLALKAVTPTPASLEYDLLPKLASAGDLYARQIPRDTYFVDIGLPETLKFFSKTFDEILKKPALILDRDNTITRDGGYTFRTQDLEFIPGAIEAISLANKVGWYVFVVTNQSGINRGYYSEEEMHEFHSAINAELSLVGAHVDAFEFCPHTPDEKCGCRKPGIEMLERLHNRYPFDISRSLMIGDKQSDAQCGNAFGVESLIIEPEERLIEKVRGWIEKCM